VAAPDCDDWQNVKAIATAKPRVKIFKFIFKSWIKVLLIAVRRRPLDGRTVAGQIEVTVAVDEPGHERLGREVERLSALGAGHRG